MMLRIPESPEIYTPYHTRRKSAKVHIMTQSQCSGTYSILADHVNSKAAKSVLQLDLLATSSKVFEVITKLVDHTLDGRF